MSGPLGYSQQLRKQVQNYRRYNCHNAVVQRELSKVFLGIYSSLIFKAYLPLHIKVYRKRLMNKTTMICLLKIHSLCSQRPSSQTLWPSFHDLVSIIISYFLPAVLLGMWTLHLNIFFSLLLKSIFMCQSPTAYMPVVSLLWKSLLCKPHPSFKSQFKSYFFWPFQVKVTF